MASGSRRAAAAKPSSGSTVTGPVSTSQPSNAASPPARTCASAAPGCVKVHHASSGTATTAISAVSAARPSRAPSAAVLRTRPYSANRSASASAIQGSAPAVAVSQTTPAAASATAVHCTGRSRSPSTATPSATLTIGLMK